MALNLNSSKSLAQDFPRRDDRVLIRADEIWPRFSWSGQDQRHLVKYHSTRDRPPTDRYTQDIQIRGEFLQWIVRDMARGLVNKLCVALVCHGFEQIGQEGYVWGTGDWSCCFICWRGIVLRGSLMGCGGGGGGG